MQNSAVPNIDFKRLVIPSLHNFDSVDKNKMLLCLLGTVKCYFKKIQWLRLDCRHLCVLIVCVKVNQITIPLDSKMFLVEHIVLFPARIVELPDLVYWSTALWYGSSSRKIL